jgi:hypothetical protein
MINALFPSNLRCLVKVGLAIANLDHAIYESLNWQIFHYDRITTYMRPVYALRDTVRNAMFNWASVSPPPPFHFQSIGLRRMPQIAFAES